MSNNITWVVIPTDWFLTTDRSEKTKPKKGFVIKGYSSSTKKLLHEYGIFQTLGELQDYARAHQIPVMADF